MPGVVIVGVDVRALDLVADVTVGEMTKLLSAAFEASISAPSGSRLVLLDATESELTIGAVGSSGSATITCDDIRANQ